MIRYKEFSKTSTLEFVIMYKALYVIYNGVNEIRLVDFIRKYPEAMDILKTLYDHLLKNNCVNKNNDWKKELIMFIQNRLQKDDGKLDVIIRNNGKVIINIED